MMKYSFENGQSRVDLCCREGTILCSKCSSTLRISPQSIASLTKLAMYKPCVFILTDICNEPDDAESLCRYLVYSNQFHTRGLVACNSTWMRDAVRPDAIHEILDAYGKVVDNLNTHVQKDSPYPPVKEFKALVSTGPSVYGRKALEDDVPLSEGAKMLIERVDESTSEEPLWVLCWGGTNALAQALRHVHDVEKRSEDECKAFREKLRVYAISDQDDTGALMRRLCESIPLSLKSSRMIRRIHVR
jgi:hypothetical protein